MHPVFQTHLILDLFQVIRILTTSLDRLLHGMVQHLDRHSHLMSDSHLTYSRVSRIVSKKRLPAAKHGCRRWCGKSRGCGVHRKNAWENGSLSLILRYRMWSPCHRQASNRASEVPFTHVEGLGKRLPSFGHLIHWMSRYRAALEVSELFSRKLPGGRASGV